MVVDSVTDPDALAEEACRVDLIHPETKDMMMSFPVDAKTKARSLLQSIEGKIKGQPHLFHHLLIVLKKLPELNHLGVTLQHTYGEAMLEGRGKGNGVFCSEIWQLGTYFMLQEGQCTLYCDNRSLPIIYGD